MTLRHISIFGGSLLALVAMTGCTSDEPDGGSAYIRFGMGTTTSTLKWEAEQRPTRDGSMPEIPAPLADKPATIGVWGFNDRKTEPVFVNRKMVYIYGPDYEGSGVPDPWPVTNEYPYADPETWIPSRASRPTRYKFFAYAPYVETAGDADLDEVMAYKETFDGFEAFIWRHVPQYTDNDYVLSRNMLNYISKRTGTANPVQVLEMEHLYSRLRFCFILSPEFGDLREIRLRSVTVNNLPSDRVRFTTTFTKEPDNDANDNYVYTASRIWETETSTGTTISLTLPLDDDLLQNTYYQDPLYPVVDNDKYLLLNEVNREKYGYLPMSSLYLFPYNTMPTVEISVLYDVYDKDGLLLRKGETASNTFDLGFSAYGSGTGRVLQPGYYYDLKVEIKPRFLYVLSDNDVHPDISLTLP